MGLGSRTVMFAGDDPAPLGEVPLAPEALTGRPRLDLARDMAAHLRAIQPASGADALRALRSAFPNAPLSTRATVLAAIMWR